MGDKILRTHGGPFLEVYICQIFPKSKKDKGRKAHKARF